MKYEQAVRELEEIVEIPILTRKNNHRQPCMPIYLKLHVSLQML